MNDLQNDLSSLGGHQPYVPVVLHNDKPKNLNSANAPGNSCNSQNICGIQNDWKQRARVLCSYDATDSTELNLSANEIIFVTELNPLNSDYMYGKQGLMNGLVPKAFLELLEE
ncbi:endophilin-B1-like [Sitodiplosis mosellana]|uniref:endophilin-B1-like n=1 Tax=Sitodiplosis mosellana TaxID=263140 RepID=UPI00244404C8|nr:endophilin-B1-like [Sitodiplosis mosellana]